LLGAKFGKRELLMNLLGKISFMALAVLSVLGVTPRLARAQTQASPQTSPQTSAQAPVPAQAPAPGTFPVYKITPETSSIKFSVKSSVSLEGEFEKWDATLTFASTDVSTGVLDIKIQAASVNTGSGFKDDKLKSKDFFDVTQDPLITFKSTKIVQTGPTTFEVQGNFTIRGVTKPDTLELTVQREGHGTGEIKGTMAFDRKDYGMNSGIPFIKIADRVQVTVALQAKRVSGPPVIFKQY
jgi:polyisoprenoid-binding protein YceI